MPIDLSAVPDEARPQAMMFATILESLPTEGLELLKTLVQEEIDSRG